MLPQLFDNTTIPILQEVLHFSEARHNVLAGNIANADTPGYRVRDLSVEAFQQRLKEAIETRAASRLSASQSGYPSGRTRPSDDPLHYVRDSTRTITFLDGSDVGIEQQVTEIAKNQFMHNLAAAIMSSQFRLLQTAISERV